MIVNLAVANWLFPESMRQNLDILTFYIFPVLEIGIVAFIVWKVRQTIITYKQSQGSKTDFYEILKETTLSIVPSKKLAPLVASEIAMFYYAFFVWRKQKNEDSYTHYKENGEIPIKNIVSSSYNGYKEDFERQTYISRVGIYDKNKNLIATAKLATPVKKTNKRDFTFKLKLDF